MANFGLMQVPAESVSNITLTASVTIGQRRWLDGLEYVYVYNVGGASASPGYGVTVSGGSGYSITVSSIAGQSPLIGVVKHATFTTGCFGWVVVRGPTNIEVGATTSLGTAAGEQTANLGADGVFDRVTSSTGLTNQMGGAYALSSTAAGASMLAFVQGVG